MVILLSFLNFFINFLCFFIINYKFNKSCLRIDIKFSFSFDKIFIGSLSPNRNTYNTTSEFNINEIDRFILENNNGNELKVKFKGGLSKTICYINNMKIGFQELLDILNQKIVDIQNNNNNAEQQHLNELLPSLSITPD